MSIEAQFRKVLSNELTPYPDHLLMKYFRLARLLDQHPELLALHLLMLGLETDLRTHRHENDVELYNSHLDAIYESLEELGAELDWEDDDEDD